MNISHLLKSPTTATVADTRLESTPPADTSPAALSRKGSVDLSAAARHLSSLQGGVADIDEHGVEQIRAAIAAGKLKIDPTRIADGILASARELLK
ncbi:flagellar biosynthesis anti-sigma factor FlgM [Alcaligenaceae bacterium]|nr:flagellar biosynthesis anti-sigma factor FlgM [Alcaligenaceae bacterium]